MNKKLLVFLFAILLFSCSQRNELSRSDFAIQLAYNNDNSASRVDNLVADDKVGVFCALDGTENYTLHNALFTVGADGLITSSPAVYYPDPKQPVTLRAYYPYNSSVADAAKLPFTVSTDLKQSDLCYAQAEALPSKEAQALPFKHILSRVVLDITTNSNIKSVTSVKFINTATDLTLNIETGVITLGAPSKSLTVNNSEAIVPPQTFAAGEKMLEITVETKAGASEVYYYSPLSATTLEQGKSHSFSLSLADNKTVILNGSPQISPWTEGATTGTADQKVSNQLALHLSPVYSRAADVDKIVLTLTDKTNRTTQHTIDKPTYSNSSFAFDFAPAGIIYPYTIKNVDFYKSTTLLQSYTNLLAADVYKSGNHTVGLFNAVKIGNLWWATGNLVATNTTTQNNAGLGGARIGAPTDGGLYFKFGSLIGLKGGADGSGVGIAVNTHNTGYWLRPTGHTASTAWSNAAYFSDASKTSGDLRDYVTTDNAVNNGIGDACRYYLGVPWRTPTGREYGDLCNKQYAISTNVGWAATGGQEVAIPAYGGWWNGKKPSTTSLTSAVYFVGSGYRNPNTGALSGVGSLGIRWSSSISSSVNGLYFQFNSGDVSPALSLLRVHGFPLRCVQGIRLDLEAGAFSPVASSAHTIKLRLTQGDSDNWTLTKSGAGEAAFTPNRMNGVFGANNTVEVEVAANTTDAMRTVTFTLASGGSTYDLTIEQAPAYVQIGTLRWATGNLVATNATTPNTAGAGGARIGSPTDGGLYFKFGSLVGLKGGFDGSGVGQAVKTHDKGYWLRPTGHTTSTAWSNSAYFSDESKTSGDFKDYHPTDNVANDGIGDACRYYLGAPWRTPTGQEYGDLCNKQYAISTNVGWAATGGKEVTTPVYGGWWNGSPASTTALTSAAHFVGSGYREFSAGTLINVGSQGFYWSSSIGSATSGLYLTFAAGYVYPQSNSYRVDGFTLRCVQ